MRLKMSFAKIGPLCLGLNVFQIAVLGQLVVIPKRMVCDCRYLSYELRLSMYQGFLGANKNNTPNSINLE